MIPLLILEMNGLPPLANRIARGRSVHAARSERKKWRHWIKILAMSKWLDKEPLLKARLVFIRCSSVQPDFDGMVSSWKGLQDGLVDAGVLIDDSPKVIGQPDYRWLAALPGKGSIRMEVYAA